MPAAATQEWLRSVFEVWGLPACLRVDNGTPWGNPGDLPSALALWLIGLGVDLHWNHPRRPHENGGIERFNGLLDQWGEPDQCADGRAWQAKLDWLLKTQRERYPAVHGLTRLQAFPDLLSPPRPYQRTAESRLWRLDRVQQFLAAQGWSRKADSVGAISIYNRLYSLGRRAARQTVTLRFDALANAWVAFNEADHEVGRWSATQITAPQIQALDIGYVKPARLKARPPAKLRCVYDGAA